MSVAAAPPRPYPFPAPLTERRTLCHPRHPQAVSIPDSSPLPPPPPPPPLPPPPPPPLPLPPPPPAAPEAETVFTRIAAVTRTTRCGRGLTRMELKPPAGTVKVASLCSQATLLAKGATTPRRFVADAVAVIGRSTGRRALPLSRMACPSGFSRLNKNLNDGAGPVDGVITSIVLCVRMVTPASGVAPLLGMATASSAAGCDGAAGWRPVAFGGARSGARSGAAANLAEGTPGAPVFLCVRHRA